MDFNEAKLMYDLVELKRHLHRASLKIPYHIYNSDIDELKKLLQNADIKVDQIIAKFEPK